jgi:hypothetical protein
MKKIRKKQIRYILAAFILVLCIAALASQARRIELLMERGDIENALHHYFAAEMNRNYQEVFACLAPSSVYRCTHTYKEYLRDVKDSPVRIADYTIVDIYNLRENSDRATYPDVDRFVQAEVDVVVLYTDTNDKRTVNYCFTFLKEKGTWYKG